MFPESGSAVFVKKLLTMFAPVIALLVYFNGGLGFLGMSGARDTANLAQGLSIGTEAKMLINEHWAMTGALPCEPGELDFRMSPGHGPSVLAAIDVTGCGRDTVKGRYEGLRITNVGHDQRNVCAKLLYSACGIADECANAIALLLKLRDDLSPRLPGRTGHQHEFILRRGGGDSRERGQQRDQRSEYRGSRKHRTFPAGNEYSNSRYLKIRPVLP